MRLNGALTVVPGRNASRLSSRDVSIVHRTHSFFRLFTRPARDQRWSKSYRGCQSRLYSSDAQHAVSVTGGVIKHFTPPPVPLHGVIEGPLKYQSFVTEVENFTPADYVDATTTRKFLTDSGVSVRIYNEEITPSHRKRLRETAAAAATLTIPQALTKSPVLPAGEVQFVSKRESSDEKAPTSVLTELVNEEKGEQGWKEERKKERTRKARKKEPKQKKKEEKKMMEKMISAIEERMEKRINKMISTMITKEESIIPPKIVTETRIDPETREKSETQIVGENVATRELRKFTKSKDKRQMGYWWRQLRKIKQRIRTWRKQIRTLESRRDINQGRKTRSKTNAFRPTPTPVASAAPKTTSSENSVDTTTAVASAALEPTTTKNMVVDVVALQTALQTASVLSEVALDDLWCRAGSLVNRAKSDTKSAKIRNTAAALSRPVKILHEMKNLTERTKTNKLKRAISDTDVYLLHAGRLLQEQNDIDHEDFLPGQVMAQKQTTKKAASSVADARASLERLFSILNTTTHRSVVTNGPNSRAMIARRLPLLPSLEDVSKSSVSPTQVPGDGKKYEAIISQYAGSRHSEKRGLNDPLEVARRIRESNLPQTQIPYEELLSLDLGAKELFTPRAEELVKWKPRAKGLVTSRAEELVESRGEIVKFRARNLVLNRLPVDKSKIPPLAHGLDRVLFHDKVYPLQDERSGVYNFDPYLENIMPIEEFNFDALSPFITSSKDTKMTQLAAEHGMRYSCSTSSISLVMGQIHRFISFKRDINLPDLPAAVSKQPTPFYSSPAAIFLRHKNGSYAVDGDKTYDLDTILSRLGHVLEKLLTRSPTDFEQYRASRAEEFSERHKSEGETYQFSTLSKFMMRSQLDSHDPRLPGSGVFDLKTRAVHPIRLDVHNYKDYADYNIRFNKGLWESYERELNDLARGTMMKYLLQTRMGDMDGIFLAYHNVERMFGFQYLGIESMDDIIHGTRDPAIGNAEFKYSVAFIELIFDKATEMFPGQSIRFHFDADPKMDGLRAPSGFMRVFAEPYTEQEIDIANAEKEGMGKLLVEKMMAGQNAQTTSPGGTPSNDTANIKTWADFDQEWETRLVKRSRALVGWDVQVKNFVDGEHVPRPQKLSFEQNWDVEFEVQQIKDPREAYFSARKRRQEAVKFEDEGRSRLNYVRDLQKVTEKSRKWRQRKLARSAGTEQVFFQEGEAFDAFWAAKKETNPTETQPFETKPDETEPAEDRGWLSRALPLWLGGRKDS